MHEENGGGQTANESTLWVSSQLLMLSLTTDGQDLDTLDRLDVFDVSIFQDSNSNPGSKIQIPNIQKKQDLESTPLMQLLMRLFKHQLIRILI